MTRRASSNLMVIGVLAAAVGCKPAPEEEVKVTPETILTPDDKAKYTVAFGTDGRVSARIDCNQGSGAWKSPGPGQLEFGPLAMTMAMCPPAPLNERLPKQWQYVRSYVMKDGHLFLSLMADGGIYEFEPMVEGTVTGTALYRERIAMPPGAVFEATLHPVLTRGKGNEVELMLRRAN